VKMINTRFLQEVIALVLVKTSRQFMELSFFSNVFTRGRHETPFQDTRIHSTLPRLSCSHIPFNVSFSPTIKILHIKSSLALLISPMRATCTEILVAVLLGGVGELRFGEMRSYLQWE
jgi:hypothetical protein